jgi:Fic family protein
MILYELIGTEDHPAYQDLSIDNLERQYDFLRSIVNAAIALERPMISSAIICALNAHAISCLHVNAGQFRPCDVTVGEYKPPEHFRVQELMNAFVNEVNHDWETVDIVALATFVLWRLNFIHPFINGNGRTARALCYFVICVKAGGLLKGETTLPELIRANRDEYVTLLQAADAAFKKRDSNYLEDLHVFLTRLLNEQLNAAGQDGPAD